MTRSTVEKQQSDATSPARYLKLGVDSPEYACPCPCIHSLRVIFLPTCSCGLSGLTLLLLSSVHGTYFLCPRVLLFYPHQTIMNLYVQRTHGTYVVNKGSALLWQFRDADPEFGWIQSKELEDHLTTVLKPFRSERKHRVGCSTWRGLHLVWSRFFFSWLRMCSGGPRWVAAPEAVRRCLIFWLAYESLPFVCLWAVSITHMRSE